jgi:hypothetical protein
MNGGEEDLDDHLEAEGLLHRVHGTGDLGHVQQVWECRWDQALVSGPPAVNILVPAVGRPESVGTLPCGSKVITGCVLKRIAALNSDLNPIIASGHILVFLSDRIEAHQSANDGPNVGRLQVHSYLLDRVVAHQIRKVVVDDPRKRDRQQVPERAERRAYASAI